jgi:protein SCO1/2
MWTAKGRKSLMPRRAVLIFAAAILLLAAGLGGYAWTIRQAAQPQGSGVALVGGPFSLTDQDGRRVTEKDFLGRYMLVFFGFTYCPDICPTELQNISGALDAMGPDAAKFTPVFITIDPERDTPDAMGKYLTSFHPSFIGLTGTAEQVAKAAGAYRIFYSKEVPPDAPDAYTMNHSGYVYLMDCQGRYIRHFDAGTSGADIARALKDLLDPDRT